MVSPLSQHGPRERFYKSHRLPEDPRWYLWRVTGEIFGRFKNHITDILRPSEISCSSNQAISPPHFYGITEPYCTRRCASVEFKRPCVISLASHQVDPHAEPGCRLIVSYTILKGPDTPGTARAFFDDWASYAWLFNGSKLYRSILHINASDH